MNVEVESIIANVFEVENLQKYSQNGKSDFKLVEI